MKFEFCRQISEKKNTQISNFVKIYLVGAKLLYADMKLIVASRNFANAPKNHSILGG